MAKVPCGSCGRMLFTGSGSRPIPTCRPCRNAANPPVDHVPRGTEVTKGCGRCAKPFTFLTTTSPVRYCPACVELGRKGHPTFTDRRKAIAARYRARRTAAEVEVFPHSEIFQRDGWRCQICKRKTQPEAPWPSPLYPTLDHIVPLAKGGQHTRANVQCACFECNTSKGARLLASGEQLRLIG